LAYIKVVKIKQAYSIQHTCETLGHYRSHKQTCNKDESQHRLLASNLSFIYKFTYCLILFIN